METWKSCARRGPGRGVRGPAGSRCLGPAACIGCNHGGTAVSAKSVAESAGEAPGTGEVGQKWLQHWLAALRWQRRVDEALARFDLSFAQWLVLDCLETIHRETGAAVSQVQVSRRLEFGKGSVSRWMVRLDRRGLVDIAPA